MKDKSAFAIATARHSIFLIVCFARNNENWWCRQRESLGINACGETVTISARCRFQNLLVFEPSLPGSLPPPHTKIKSAKRRLNFWCGQRESNPRLKLGKLSCYHYTMPAIVCLYSIFLYNKCPDKKFNKHLTFWDF